LSGGGKPAEVKLRIKKRNRFRGPAGGEGHENRAEFGFKFLAYNLAAFQKRLKNGSRPSRQDFFVGDEEEVAKPLRIFSRIEQMGFRRERQPREVI